MAVAVSVCVGVNMKVSVGVGKDSVGVGVKVSAGTGVWVKPASGVLGETMGLQAERAIWATSREAAAFLTTFPFSGTAFFKLSPSSEINAEAPWKFSFRPLANSSCFLGSEVF